MNRHTVRRLTGALLLTLLAPILLGADDPYEQGRAALDRQQWQQAEALFREAARGGARADAALYWQAYALGKMGRVDGALRVLEDLERSHPGSSWLDDARELRAELRGGAAAGENDEELRTLALMGLLQSNPERALPHLEKFLAGDNPVQAKEQALFLLLQTGLPRATEIVVGLAKDAKREPELRAAAVRSLGVAGGDRSREQLAEIYRSAGDAAVKQAVLDAYMVGGFEQELVAAARSEPDLSLREHAIRQLGPMGSIQALDTLAAETKPVELRRAVLQACMVAGHTAPVVRVARDPADPLRNEAIQQLGVMGGNAELWQIYDAEKSIEVRQSIIRSQGVGGDTARVLSIARSDPEPALRAAAIEALGVGGGAPASALTEMYRQEKDFDVKHAVLQALFIRGEVRALIDISRKESDPRLKRDAVQFLAVSGSEEALEYMQELLDERKTK